jgi:hypothetical protein
MVTFNPELSPHFSGFLFAWDLWSRALRGTYQMAPSVRSLEICCGS